MKKLNVRVEMVDGRELTCQSALRDYVRYEETAKRQKPPWGGISDNPSRWEGFIAWSALKRTGQYDGTWESFLDDAAIVDANAEEPVEPTSPASGVTYS